MTVAENKGQRYENYSHDWWTPLDWKMWATLTLQRNGGKVMDPCPGDWQPGDPSALEIPWGDCTYLNHPGAKGSTALYWTKLFQEQARHGGRMAFMWCLFNIEQLRHMYPSPFNLDGWLIMPRDRIKFIWGGPDIPAEFGVRKGKRVQTKAPRFHGEPMKSPGNWTAFWSTVEPMEPPEPCVIIRTGGRRHYFPPGIARDYSDPKWDE